MSYEKFSNFYVEYYECMYTLRNVKYKNKLSNADKRLDSITLYMLINVQ